MHRKALEPSQTLFSVDTNHLSNQQWKSFLNAVNIRREYIPEGRLVLLIWVSPEHVDEIHKLAPDFWSFRTSVHRFHSKPFHRRGRIERLKDLKEQIQEIDQLIEQMSKKKEPKEPVLAWLYYRLGELTYEASDLTTALRAFQKAEALFRKLDDQRNLSATISYIGVIYRDKGELEEALKYLQEALKIDREIGYLKGVATDLGNICLIYKAKGDLQKAEEVLKERESIRAREGVVL